MTGELAADPLVTAAELRDRLDDPRLRIADVRWYLGEPLRGRAEYVEGHIPGAVFVDLDRDLAAASGPGRHPLPDPTGFAGRLGELGFGDGHRIVACDTSGGMVAARLWWMLDRLGHHDVAVLDGGLAAWVEAGGELTSMLPTPLRATLTLADRWPGTIDREALAADPRSVDLLDLRAPERYRGEIEPVDRAPGHIPGARNLPAARLLDDHGRLRPPRELRGLLTAQATDHAPMVMSCGSGVTACLGILAARRAGLPEPLLYAGSFSDWSSARLPIATGDEP
jgi:thiosulfate/3-mercaptopyruvate sulfurtransferase